MSDPALRSCCGTREHDLHEDRCKHMKPAPSASEPQCTGPFSDDRDCPVHSRYLKSPAPSASDTTGFDAWWHNDANRAKDGTYADQKAAWDAALRSSEKRVTPADVEALRRFAEDHDCGRYGIGPDCERCAEIAALFTEPEK